METTDIPPDLGGGFIDDVSFFVDKLKHFTIPEDVPHISVSSLKICMHVTGESTSASKRGVRTAGGTRE